MGNNKAPCMSSSKTIITEGSQTFFFQIIAHVECKHLVTNGHETLSVFLEQKQQKKTPERNKNL